MSGRAERTRIELWAVALDALPASPERFDAALRSLSAGERERAEGLRHVSDRRRAVLRWATLRHLLGDYLGEPPSSVRLTASPAGKPRLAGATALQFSVSHRDGLALYAFSWDRPVGVDVERVRPVPEADAIVASLCAAEEARHYAALPARLRPSAFLDLWTCKEAYLKGTGEGIAHGLDRFAVVGSGDDRRIQRLDGSPLGRDDWHLRVLWMDAAHRGALACPGAPPEVVHRQLTSLPVFCREPRVAGTARPP